MILGIYFVWSYVANLFYNNNLFYKYISLIWVQGFCNYERINLFIEIHLGKLYDYIYKIH
jgi:hypothetical protein